jgi:hypothetical protein
MYNRNFLCFFCFYLVNGKADKVRTERDSLPSFLPSYYYLRWEEVKETEMRTTL